jgi:hypothetical protein
MIKLHVVQAEYGDCIILEFGSTAQPKFVLVDGGPATTYDRHLRGILQSIGGAGGSLEAVVLSHVDTDHIAGLLDFFAELRQQRADGDPETVGVNALWHNSFSRTLDPQNTIEARLRVLMSVAGASQAMTLAGMSFNSIADGNALRLAALALGVPLNQGFAGDVITVDNAGEPVWPGDSNLQMRVVGPTQQNLAGLAAEWQQWLDEHENAILSGDPLLMANSDRRVPNLSSIMLLAEADGKSILLTGDGRSDHLLEGLVQSGAMSQTGTLHVDLLKLPHHGSDCNMTKKFFRTVTADQYVVSANGKDGNPDLATLIWLVEAALEQNRHPEIVVTNRTPSTDKLLEEYPAAKYGYALTIARKDRHEILLEPAV